MIVQFPLEQQAGYVAGAQNPYHLGIFYDSCAPVVEETDYGRQQTTVTKTARIGLQRVQIGQVGCACAAHGVQLQAVNLLVSRFCGWTALVVAHVLSQTAQQIRHSNPDRLAGRAHTVRIVTKHR